MAENKDDNDKKQEPTPEYQYFKAHFDDLQYKFGTGTSLIPLPTSTALVPMAKSKALQPVSHAQETGAAPETQTAWEPAVEPVSETVTSADTTLQSIANSAAGSMPLLYPFWLHNPPMVAYQDKSSVQFKYGLDGHVSEFIDRRGAHWVREEPSRAYGCFRWQSSLGNTAILAMQVLSDGTWLVLRPSGEVERTTPDGQSSLMYGLPPGFDVNTLLTRMFGIIDKNKDTAITRSELNEARLRHWDHPDEAYVVALLTAFFDSIIELRDDPLERLSGGITFNEIVRFDQKQRQLNLQCQHLPPVFAGMLSKLFAEVDENKDGIITLNEIVAALQNKHLVPWQNNVLCWLRDNIWRLRLAPQPLQPQLSQPDGGAQIYKRELLGLFEALYRDNIRLKVNCDAWATNVGRNLLTSQEYRWKSPFLYADPLSPSESLGVSALHHGTAGDTMFAAAIGSALAVNPLLIMKTLKDNDDGTYTVTFLGDSQHPLVLGPPMAIDLAAYVHGDKFGIWAPTLARAFHLYCASFGIAPAPDGEPPQTAPVQLLTGTSGIWLRSENSSVLDFKTVLNSAWTQRRLLLAATWGWVARKPAAPQIGKNRTYSIIGWNPNTDEVTLRDPWGYIGSSGNVLDGTNGIFSLTLSQLHEGVQGLYLQDSALSQFR